MRKIILSGYMGSGKTTVARLLHIQTDVKCLDLDKLIEEESGLPINEIFDLKGEIFFRKKEHEILKNVLSNNEQFILSLGGGTPCYYNNMEIIEKSNAVSFYLKSSADQLLQRVNNNIENRPLLSDKSPEDLIQFIAKHIFERSFYYNRCTFTIDTDTLSADEVAQEILNILA